MPNDVLEAAWRSLPEADQYAVAMAVWGELTSGRDPQRWKPKHPWSRVQKLVEGAMSIEEALGILGDA